MNSRMPEAEAEKIDHELRTSCYGEIEELFDEVEVEFMEFKNFDLLDSPPSDHQLRTSNFSCCAIFGQVCKRSLIKKIGEEWKLVKAKLPSTIYARVYASMKDVMRVAIVAEKDSSYHHGLFFFDIRFPRSYPSEPPQLFHHSSGELKYANILRRATRKEKREYPILEVLVFVQQLVSASSSGNPDFDSGVSSKEDFAELPMKDKKKKKEALMKMCGAMLRMLGSPPKGFEAFVAGYFRTRSHRILLNYRACLDIFVDCDLRLLFFRLVRAFENNGSYCKHHYKQQHYDQALAEERTNVSLFKSKKILGCI